MTFGKMMAGKTTLAAFVAAGLCAVGSVGASADHHAAGSESLLHQEMKAGEVKSLHDFTLTSIERTDLPLSEYEGKAVLIVNTATFCGYTPQYKGLQALWDTYKDRGLVVLGIPSNDFGEQEPAGEKDIKRFCQVNYKVDFPMTKKMVVNGKEGTVPLYNWLADNLGEESRPQWNFHKYLVGPDGQPVAFFPTKLEPNSPEVIAAIEAALASGR